MLNHRECVIGARRLHDRDGGYIRRLIAEGDAKAERQQNGKTEDPEHNFGLALEFEHASLEQMIESGPASVRPLRSRCGLRHLGGRRLLRDRHHSSRKWRPVRFTKTSSRLAWRVVRCKSSPPLWPTASSRAGIVRCGSRTVSEQTPSSSRTPSTPGSTRQ